MGSMQNQLRKYKETAANVHSLRADVQSLSNILNQKVEQLEKLSAISVAQDTEMLKLQAIVQDLKENAVELNLFLDMFRRESPYNR
nr:E3 ubiquitin-protein ligase bre1-like 1 [Ipomoea batatas]